MTSHDVANDGDDDILHVDAIAKHIKSLMFEYVDSSDAIPALVRRQDFDGVSLDIISACYDDVISVCPKKELALGVLATGILHYILTKALIKSQRNISHCGVDVDIVIPDAKTLECDPHRTLLICIAKADDSVMLQKIISDASRIQPVKENIWIILPSNTSHDLLRESDSTIVTTSDGGDDTGVKIFVISKDGGSFVGIFSKIGEFVNYGGRGNNTGHGADNLRILGI